MGELDGRATSIESLLDGDPDGLLAALREAVATGDEDAVPLDDVQLLAPIARPGKIVAVGRNYREHAFEEGAALPVRSGPVHEVLELDHGTRQRDPVARGRHGAGRLRGRARCGHRAAEPRDIAVDDALDSVFGYTCLNDVSARDLQVQDGQWLRAKSLDTFCPIGPGS